MTVLERRVRIATAILNDLDDKDFSEIEKAFKRIIDPKKQTLPEPCAYTMEEVREIVQQRKKDFDAGKIKLIPHEQVKRKSIS